MIIKCDIGIGWKRNVAEKDWRPVVLAASVFLPNTGKLLLEGYSQPCAVKIKSKINRVKLKTTWKWRDSRPWYFWAIYSLFRLANKTHLRKRVWNRQYVHLCNAFILSQQLAGSLWNALVLWAFTESTENKVQVWEKLRKCAMIENQEHCLGGINNSLLTGCCQSADCYLCLRDSTSGASTSTCRRRHINNSLLTGNKEPPYINLPTQAHHRDQEEDHGRDGCPDKARYNLQARQYKRQKEEHRSNTSTGREWEREWEEWVVIYYKAAASLCVCVCMSVCLYPPFFCRHTTLGSQPNSARMCM